MAEEPPDGQRHQRPTERLDEATVAVLLALAALGDAHHGEEAAGDDRGDPQQPDGVEQRAGPARAGAEHVLPERPVGEAVERGAADPHDHQRRRADDRRDDRHPRTPMRATHAESAPKASPVREPRPTPPQPTRDRGHARRRRGTPRAREGSPAGGTRGGTRTTRRGTPAGGPRRQPALRVGGAAPVEERHHAARTGSGGERRRRAAGRRSAGRPTTPPATSHGARLAALESGPMIATATTAA